MIESYLTSEEMNETLKRVYGENKKGQTIRNKKLQNQTLKATSPFVNYFIHMIEIVKKFENAVEFTENNSLCSTELTTFLKGWYLPYCFIYLFKL